jgi:hypothetical protein
MTCLRLILLYSLLHIHVKRYDEFEGGHFSNHTGSKVRDWVRGVGLPPHTTDVSNCELVVRQGSVGRLRGKCTVESAYVDRKKSMGFVSI